MIESPYIFVGHKNVSIVVMPVSSDSGVSPSQELARKAKYSGIKTKLDLFRFTQFYEPVKRWPFLTESVERQAS